VKIYRDIQSGSAIYKVSVDDIDPGDVSTLAISTTNDALSPFYYDRTDRKQHH